MKDIKRIAEELIKIAEKLIKIGVEEEDEELELDWDNPPELTPKLEKILRQYGFTYEEFLKWFEAFAETDAPSQLRAFVIVGDLKDLVKYFAWWKEEKIDPVSAAAWTSAKWFTADFASIWHHEGFEPDEATEWIKELDLDTELGIDEAVKWRDLGLTPKEAKELKDEGYNVDVLEELTKYFGNIDDAIEWHRYFDNPKEAKKWHKYFEDPGEAHEWMEYGFSPKEALKWAKYGFDAEDAYRYKDLGYTPERASRELKRE